jgi:formyltetrahydrofolate-dependent phosphoribosylglycinamide formyltransferase
LLISIPLGQFGFFKRYILKIGKRVGLGRKAGGSSQLAVGGGQLAVGSGQLVKIAIFASGAGSNAEKIIQVAQPSGSYTVELVVCNKPAAGVLQIAAANNIDTLLITREDMLNPAGLIAGLKKREIGLVVLAGFLWKLPPELIKAFPGRIVNIHPALLPKFGGKGMYGHFVHEAVIAAGEKESGISIHYVDDLYDHGNIIFQATCTVDAAETAETLAGKIHLLEHEHYPKLLKQLIEKM